MRFGLVLFVLIGLIGCSSIKVQSQRGPASVIQAQDLIARSAWFGTFRSAETVHQMRLIFLADTNKTGSFQYFHGITGGFGKSELQAIDGACPFTPRAIAVTPTGSPYAFRGTISVYPCASSPSEEATRNGDSGRLTLAKIPVSKFEFSEDGTHLEIQASVKGLLVSYSLDRQQPDASDMQSPLAMRGWVSEQ